MALGRAVPAGAGTAAIGALTPAMIAALRREQRRNRRILLAFGLGLELALALLVLIVWIANRGEVPNADGLILPVVVIALVTAVATIMADVLAANSVRGGEYVRYEGPFVIDQGGSGDTRYAHLVAGEYVADIGGCEAAIRKAGAGVAEFTIGGILFAADDATGAPLYRHPRYRPDAAPPPPAETFRARLNRFLDGD